MPVLLPWALAGALTGPVELEWRAPEGCASREAVVAEVERLLAGRTPATAAVRAEVAASGEGVAGTVVIAGAAPRTLRASGCEALAQAVAVVIAVAVDPGLAGTLDAELVPPPPGPVTPDESPTPAVGAAGDATSVPGDPAPAAVVVAPPVAAAAPVKPPPPVWHAVGVRGGALIGLSDLPTAGIGLTYALERGLLRVEARAMLATPRRITYDDVRDGPGVRVQAVTFGALGCVSPGSATVRVPMCLGAEAGPMIGQGIGVPDGRTRATLWASGLLTAAVVGRVSRRFNLIVGAEFGVALRRPAFHVGAREELVRSRAFGARILLGFEIVFGR